MFRFRTSIVTIMALAALGLAAGASGQVKSVQTVVKHRPTFVEADFGKIATYVGQLSSRTIEIEPGVCALVTANWDKPQTPDQLYSSFVEIARVLGYVVVEEGVVTKIQLAPETPRDPTPPCRRYPVRNNPAQQ
jgi:type II secretory pathway component GspD/PulD (secretin)